MINPTLTIDAKVEERIGQVVNEILNSASPPQSVVKRILGFPFFKFCTFSECSEELATVPKRVRTGLLETRKLHVLNPNRV